MKKKYLFVALLIAGLQSCSDFLDKYPGDVLTPDTFWKTEADAKLGLVGCYRDWEGEGVLYRDCGSDNAYSFHKHEGWQVIGNGGMSSADPGSGYYDYKVINRCNEFLEQIDAISFKDAKLKERYKAEVRFIRAYQFMLLTLNYGDVPLSLKTYSSIEEARLTRTPKAEVEKFILQEMQDVAAILPEKYNSADIGRITKGAALAMRMRLNLYLGQFESALADATAIKDLNVYQLFPTYDGIFHLANINNKEVILDVQYKANDKENWLIAALFPNGDGGWSSIVPINSLVNAYEMKDGTTIEEAKQNGKYDVNHPFLNRDPRLKMSILYPGQNWNGRIFDPLAKNITEEGVEVSNPDYFNGASNASKSGYAMKKYTAPVSQFDDPWNTSLNIIVSRYAEVLLTIAEAKIELGQIDNEMYTCLDMVRERAGMPKVDRAKYASKEKLRELVRRERRVEFAFEGLRRADIIRWDIAKDVLNGQAEGTRMGTININEPNEDKRALLNGDPIFIEDRKFQPFNKYLPIGQDQLDLNPNLTQTPGYN